MMKLEKNIKSGSSSRSAKMVRSVLFVIVNTQFTTI